MKKIFLSFIIFASCLSSEKSSSVATLVRRISDKVLTPKNQPKKFTDEQPIRDLSTIDQGKPIALEGDPTSDIERKLAAKEIKDFQEVVSSIKAEIMPITKDLIAYVERFELSQQNENGKLLKFNKRELLKYVVSLHNKEGDIMVLVRKLLEKVDEQDTVIKYYLKEIKLKSLDKDFGLK